jgi:O-succinylbenzoate synthase
MKIERIELRHISMQLITPFTTSMGTESFEEHIIVRVDSEGISGWGEVVVEPLPHYSPETVQTAGHILRDALVPGVLGKAFDSVDHVLASWNWVRGHRMAKAGLEAAVWDVFAKQAGQSLSAYMGGERKKVDVGVSIGIHHTPARMLASVQRFVSEGYRRIKIKIAPGSDMEFIEAIRVEYPDILFQVDANSAYTLDDVDTFRQMEPYDLLLIEQPLGYEDIYDHSLLQRQIKTPLCLDESIHSLGDARAAVALDSCRVINIKPGRVGGFSESIKIHDLCLAKNIDLWHGGMLESGIGRAGNLALASLPGFNLPGDISASNRYFHEDIVEPEFTINPDSTMDVPTGPGIGVTVNEEKLARVTVHKEEFSA